MAVLSVIHEDADLLVIDKPAGLVCHPTKDGEMSSLIGRVRLHLGHAEGRLVNRLDRETSGLVVIAKGAVVAREIGHLFASNSVQKTYHAVVHGHADGDLVTIDAPLGRDDTSPVVIKNRVRADGAVAVTDIRVVRTFTRQEGAFSLLRVTPRTGRKHQIRIHLAHIGHPIVGDKLYGSDEQRYLRLVAGALSAADRRDLIFEHHALHAARVTMVWRERTWVWETSERAEINAFCGP